MTLIDISIALREGMICWPGSAGVRLERTLDLAKGDPVNNSRLTCDVHAGTHVDAPLHHLVGGADAASLALEAMVGPVVVADLPDAGQVTATALEKLELPATIERLLLRTRNSGAGAAGRTTFSTDYVALTADAAAWVVERRLRLVGIDGPSIQRFHDGPETHRVLLAAGVVIVEGLDLAQVAAGDYELLCLPLRLVGSEGAPARAVLRRSAP